MWCVVRPVLVTDLRQRCLRVHRTISGVFRISCFLCFFLSGFGACRVDGGSGRKEGRGDSGRLSRGLDAEMGTL